MCGPTCTQSSPMTRIRNPFRTIASGITKATSTIRRHGLSRKRWEATRLVMKSTQLEWMPLHSWATSQDNPGQREHRAVAQQRSARHLEEQGRDVRRGQHRSRFEPIHRRIRQRNHEDQERDGKGRGGHPFRAKEQKPTGGDDAHIGERHQGEAIVDAQAPTPAESLRQAPRRRLHPG